MSHRKTMTLSKFLKGYLQEWNINQDTLAEDMDVSVNTLRDWIYKGKDANDINLEKLKGYFDGDIRFKHYLEDRDVSMIEDFDESKFSGITYEMNKLYSQKNTDYGNSFDKSLDEDGLLVSKIRLGDKYNRFARLIKHESEVKDESIEDTLIDLANYAVMTILWMRRNEE